MRNETKTTQNGKGGTMTTDSKTLVSEYKAYRATNTRTPWTHASPREEAGRLLTASNPKAEYNRHACNADNPGPYWMKVRTLVLGTCDN